MSESQFPVTGTGSRRGATGVLRGGPNVRGMPGSQPPRRSVPPTGGSPVQARLVVQHDNRAAQDIHELKSSQDAVSVLVNRVASKVEMQPALVPQLLLADGNVIYERASTGHEDLSKPRAGAKIDKEAEQVGLRAEKSDKKDQSVLMQLQGIARKALGAMRIAEAQVKAEGGIFGQKSSVCATVRAARHLATTVQTRTVVASSERGIRRSAEFETAEVASKQDLELLSQRALARFEKKHDEASLRMYVTAQMALALKAGKSEAVALDECLTNLAGQCVGMKRSTRDVIVKVVTEAKASLGEEDEKQNKVLNDHVSSKLKALSEAKFGFFGKMKRPTDVMSVLTSVSQATPEIAAKSQMPPPPPSSPAPALPAKKPNSVPEEVPPPSLEQAERDARFAIMNRARAAFESKPGDKAAGVVAFFTSLDAEIELDQAMVQKLVNSQDFKAMTKGLTKPQLQTAFQGVQWQEAGAQKWITDAMFSPPPPHARRK